MSPRKLVALLVVAGVVGGVYFWDTARVKKQEEQEEQAKRLVDVEIEGVQELRIVEGDTTIVARKADPAETGFEARWDVVEPIQTRADTTEVRAVLSTLTMAKIDRRLAEDDRGALADFGLDPPERTVTLKSATQEVVVLVGAKAAAENKAFFSRPGANEVFVLPDHVRSGTEKSLFNLRDKSLFHFGYDKEDRLRITLGDGRRTELEKRGGNWYLPERDRRADRTKVSELVSTLRNERAKDFIDDPAADLSSYGIVEGGTEVALWVEGAQQTLRLGFFHENHDGVYAQRDGSRAVLVLDREFPGKLTKDLDNLVDRALVATQSYSAGELVVYNHVDDATTAMRKVEYNWHLVEPATRELDYTLSSEPFNALTGAEALEFPRSATETVPENRWLTVRIRPSDEGTAPETVTIYREGPDDDEVYAVRGDESGPAVYLRSSIEKLLASLRDLLPEPTPAGAVETATGEW